MVKVYIGNLRGPEGPRGPAGDIGPVGPSGIEDTAGAVDGQFRAYIGGELVWAYPPSGTGGITGAPQTWPSAFPPIVHTHTSGQITDATGIGRSILTAVDMQAARAAIGAGTGNGTSNLTLGATSTTAAPGNHGHTASAVTFNPSGSITATNVQDAILQASQVGGSGGTSSGSILVVKYASGGYPAQPGSAPAGITVRYFYGPVPYTGPTWAGVLDVYTYAALT